MPVIRSTSQLLPLSAHERILTTAHELFYRVGIRATGIDRIIAQSRVTKVTFYRHFHSKNDLIRAVLQYRHELWMAWFTDSLKRHSHQGLNALVSALEEWFRDGEYRGCAFINAVVEVGDSLPGVVEISRQHKRDMIEAIAALLPASTHRKQKAEAAAMAVDGAIVRAQMAETPDAALNVLKVLLKGVL